MLPTDPKARKDTPVARGVLDYFPLAVAAVAELSRIGNEQHNPGQPMHWAREKSTDHADCIARHLIERGTVDTDGVRHSTKVAWRALALLQLEIEGAVVDKEWTPHSGGPMPCQGDTIVIVKLRDGTIDEASAREWRWSHHYMCGDIVGWKVAKVDHRKG
jgi:hypothetical protein